jgi:hypothetical protein
LDLGGTSRAEFSALLEGLNAWQFNERLGRLEQSLRQLELINGTALSLLQTIVLSIAPEDALLPEELPSMARDDPAKAKPPKASSVAQGALPFTSDPEGEVHALEQAATAGEEGYRTVEPVSAAHEAELSANVPSAAAPPALPRTKRSKQRFRRKVAPTITHIGNPQDTERSANPPEDRLPSREPE